jgi:hypothetical protein
MSKGLLKPTYLRKDGTPDALWLFSIQKKQLGYLKGLSRYCTKHSFESNEFNLATQLDEPIKHTPFTFIIRHNLLDIFSIIMHSYCDEIQEREQVISILTKTSTKIDIQDKDGKTPLHIAALERREKVVSLLIQVGAKIDIKDKTNKTPLDIAAEKGHENVVSLLQGVIIKNEEGLGVFSDDHASSFLYDRVSTITSNYLK